VGCRNFPEANISSDHCGILKVICYLKIELKIYREENIIQRWQSWKRRDHGGVSNQNIYMGNDVRLEEDVNVALQQINTANRSCPKRGEY